MEQQPYDIIVAGGGHAGIEAALASARSGKRTLLLTMNISTIGQMSCNPAIGGLAKGHLVRELDALGGEMARAIDINGIQFKMLNRSKGPAVWSPRAQADKTRYSEYMVQLLLNTPSLDVKQYMVTRVLAQDGVAVGVETQGDTRFFGRAVILSNGTFLNGKVYTGLHSSDSGRMGEAPAIGLTENLVKLGFHSDRLKTGTPPRVNARTIDFSRTRIQPGDPIPEPFRFYENLIHLPQVDCYLTQTHAITHEIIEEGLSRSPIYTGVIDSVGPRYCPSVEDKVVRFQDKTSHQIFLEPEGLNSAEIYVNGFSTSLPEDIQIRALRTIPGMEHAEITRMGYAIEYDYFPPEQLQLTLETRIVENLYFAGQINGTSGYEEAAVQGFLAAVNAVRKLDGKPAIILRRDESYIGVLIDDLITKGTREPYRMFTSRAEFRLLLRQDNADERLLPLGHELGLIDDARLSVFEQKQSGIQRGVRYLNNTYAAGQDYRDLQLQVKANKSDSLATILKRPEMSLNQMLPLLSTRPAWKSLNLNHIQLRSIEFDIKYEGYIARQLRQAELLVKSEDILIPESLDYQDLTSLSNESQQKLTDIRPVSIGQASRIPGVTPADISVLLIYLKRLQTNRRSTLV